MSQQKPYTIGFLGSLAIALAVLVFMYATTFNPSNVNVFFVMILLLIGGLALSIAMVGVRFEFFRMQRLMEALLWSVLSFTVIFVVNRMVPIRLGLAPVEESLFAILAGPAEEVFFRVWLCGWVAKATRSNFLAIFVSAFTWTIYHIYRYGGNWNALFIIFAAGCVLGWVFLQSRQGDGPIFGHMVVNAFARG